MRKFLTLILCALFALPAARADGPSAILTSFGSVGASANGACIGTSPCAVTSLVDNAGNTWTLSASACDAGSTPSCVWRNGSYAGFTSTVTIILWYSGTIYQYNGSQWFPCATNCTSGSSASVTWGAGQSDPRGSSFGIKVVNNTFTDLFNNVLQLQGIGISGLEISYAPGMWDAYNNTTQAQWTSIKTTWNINIIRLPLNEWAWRTNATSAGGTAYQTIVTNAVTRITAAGMYAILDLHWAAPASYNGYLGGRSITGYADGQPGYLNQDYSAAFWTSVANAYKSNPAVLFEIFNEPYGNNSGGSSSYTYLLNGSGSTSITFYDQYAGSGSPTATSATFKAAGHQQMVTAIRGTGATNVILWSSPVFNSQLANSLAVRPTDTLTPSQLGATIHYGGGSTTDYNNVLAANYPIVMTEFYQPLITGASNNYTSYLQPHKVGYVMWGPQNYSGTSTNNLASGSPGPQLTNTGAGPGSNIGAPWNFNSASVKWPPF